ncbi:zinc finger protein 658B-like isoform X1 [Xyrauchen texanus]|uniref:zinc finger protein 658B-like isoform X1 n=1 Tax=Xyrauchen texanus TaxID=154827 RepID=UPI0022423E6B|nr:zinc finger protein 658B-like isoform X1 [Xyrauchen texanus]
MMGLVSIHSFLIKRMMAAAEEIFDAVKDNVIEYQQEIERLKQENCYLRNTLAHTRSCSHAETHNDAQSNNADEVLQDPFGSELSEIRVKMEVATMVSHEPLDQASTITSVLSEGQEPTESLSHQPELLVKNEDSVGLDIQSSVAVKSDQCDQDSDSNPTVVLLGYINDGHVGLPIAEQDLHSRDEVSQKVPQSHQNAFACKICGKSFCSNGRLRTHMVVHQSERPFCCDFCGRCFKSKIHLKEHERLHKERRRVDQSSIEEPLDSQLSSMQITLKPDSINLDGNPQHSPSASSMTSKISLKGISVKTGADQGMNFMEKVTRECFATKAICSNISGSHTAPNKSVSDQVIIEDDGLSTYTIPDNEQTFEGISHLNLNQHHQDTEKYPVHCEICDKPFRHNQSLKIHMRVHQGVRNYHCRFCGRGFYKSCHLREHLRIHTGEKPYGCKTCGKSFVQWNQARAHIIKHHGGDMSLLSKKKA